MSLIQTIAEQPPPWRAQRPRPGFGFRSFRKCPAARTTGSGDDFRSPRPLRAAALLLAPLPVLAVLRIEGVLPVSIAAGLSSLLALLALIRSGLGAYDLHRSRQLGDALLRAHPGLPPAAGLAAWRSTELTSPHQRHQLGRLLRQLARETEACTRSRLSVTASATLDATSIVLRQLDRRLKAISDPVSPAGILDLAALATANISPLYFPERAHDLPRELARALAGLEPA